MNVEQAGLKISRILHAGYAFECDGVQILFDPIFENPFSRNCHAFPNVEFDREQIESLKPAAIFISHHHDDHCSFESLAFLNRNTPVYLYCAHEELFGWIRQMGFKGVNRLKLDSAVEIGPFKITPHKAWDDVDAIFQIQAAGLNVLNVVDALIDPGTIPLLTSQAPWDMILWPFQTLRETAALSPRRALAAAQELPPEWFEELSALNPRYIVPSSCQFIHEPWSWYNHAMFPISYRQFKDEMERALPGTQVIRLNPSVAVTLNREDVTAQAPLTWVRAIGNQDVDYEYQNGIKASSTAEISRHFPALSDAQMEDIHEYCTSTMLTRYRSLEPSGEPYFAKPKIW